MKLSPTEILNLLGFNVPEEGVTINPMDAHLCFEALRMVGGTLNVANIPDEQLLSCHYGMAELVELHCNFDAREPDAESLLKLRATIAVLLKTTFNATLIK